MRVLFLNHNLRERGTYFRAFEIARVMVRRGHRSTLLTASPGHWYRPQYETIDGVRITETPSWNPAINPDDGWGPLDLAYRLWRALVEDCDLVYAFAHPPNVYFPARLAQLLRRKPLVADWCDLYEGGAFKIRDEFRDYLNLRGWRTTLHRWTEVVDRRLERRILRKAKGVTVISRFLEREALETGVPRERVLRFPSGANLDAIAPQDKEECRRALGIDGAGPFLGYIAYYNHDERFFLSSLARVFESHPSARMISAALPFTDFLVRENGLEGRLIELGRLPFNEMSVVLGAADVLVLPLRDNAFNQSRWPNKFGDYLAAGRPIATCAVGDLADYFPPVQAMRKWLAADGDIVPPESSGTTDPRAPSGAPEDAGRAPLPIGIAAAGAVEDFGDAMSALLDRPEKWDSMGVAARETAESLLDWNRIGEQIESFLERCL
ncbi:MAG TPA: glycosyltransferase [Sumerlaeia bacterium]|nr:glycosyltransferase [Sumerlaeia bacterium]